MNKGFVGTILLILGAAGVLAAAALVNRNTDGGLTFGAPSARYEQELNPRVDSAYWLGTTSPSTLAWRGLVADEVCLAGDCQTAWPAGGGGDAFTHPSATVSASTSDFILGSNTASSTILGNFIVTGNSSTTNFAITALGGGGGDLKVASDGSIYEGSDATGGGGAFAWDVLTGYNSTSTTLGFLQGFFSTASTTISNTFRLPHLSDGLAYIGSGILQSTATSSLNTSELTNDANFIDLTSLSSNNWEIGYNNGTGVFSWLGLSTTTNSGLSQGFAYIGSGGLFQTVASSSINLSELNNDSGFITGVAWGDITGTLANQGDLDSALWNKIGTTTTLTNGQVLYATGANTASSVATGTISVPTGLTVTANRYAIGGATAVDLDTGYVIPLQSTLDGYLTSLGSGYATTTDQDVALSTSTLAFNGLTVGATFVPTAGAITYTPTITGTLDNTGLTNSTISGVALGNTLNALSNDATLSGSNYDGSGAVSDWGINLGNANTWTALQTFNYSSTTGQATFTNASSTLWYGGGLQTCNATTGKLHWANGQFSCETDQGGGGGSGQYWATSTAYAGQDLLYPNQTTNGWPDVLFGATSSTTAPFWFDVSATSTYIGNGGAGDSDLQFGADNFAWTLGLDDDDADNFVIGSTTANNLGTNNVLVLDKTLKTLFPQVSQGFAIVGSGGWLTSVASSTINLSELNNDANFITLGSLSSTWPISYNSGTGAISWVGLATTSQPTAGQLLYSNGTNGLIPIATSSLLAIEDLTDVASFSQAEGDLLYYNSGQWNRLATGTASQVLKINPSSGYPEWNTDTTGSGGAGTVSTSTTPTIGNLAYWTSSTAWPETLGTVATGTLSATSPISVSASRYLIGGDADISIATTTTNLFSGVGGNILAYVDGSGYLPIATSSINVGTATALQNNGANCSTGSAPEGVDASGAVENCFDVWTEAENTSAAYIALGDLSATWPINYNSGTGAFTWGGLATTSQPTAGQLLYSNGTNGLTPVSTSTPTISTGLSYSGTFGNVIGGSSGNLTLDTANANTWSALQTFNYSSSTAYSSFQVSSSTEGYFGSLNLPNESDGCLQTTGGLVSSTGVACGSGSGGADFTYAQDLGYGITGSATSTATKFDLGILASTTSYFSNATSTLFSVLDNFWAPASLGGNGVIVNGNALDFDCSDVTDSGANDGIGCSGEDLVVSIDNDNWDATDLSVANGGTGLSTFGGTNTILYTTAADTLSSESAFTYNPTTNLLTFDYSTSTTYSSFLTSSSTNHRVGTLTFSTSTLGCLQVGANGVAYSTGSACGSGGGDGYGFVLDSYAGTNNVQSTSSPLWLKATSPYSLIATSTFATYASSTQSTDTGASWFTALAQGYAYLGTNGRLNTVATSTIASQVFPFTSVTGYNSTSTTLGLLNGLFSTASSTFSGDVRLPALSQGFLYTGSNGLTRTVSTSTLASHLFTFNSYGMATSTITNFTNGLFTAASSTFSGTLQIPINTNPTMSVEGQVAINNTQASTSLRYYDGTAERSLYPTTDKSWSFSSSTLAYIGKYGASGTTTIRLALPSKPITLTEYNCTMQTGSVWLEFGDGSATTTSQCTTSSGWKSPASNNTWVRGETFYIAIGMQSGNPSDILVNAVIRQDAD